MTQAPHDVVVFGATSFVGQILCRYLVEQFGVDGELRWAAAGRSLAKLESLRENLGRKAKALPLLVAEASDSESLRTLCAQARVVVSTVGPYALYGEPLVQVCSETGTDYCDLTGEVQWIRRMIHAHQTAAKQSGARIVHCCGFDSLPSDLGVWFLQQEALRRFGAPCTQVKMRVKAMRGGFSGGTVASLINIANELRREPSLRRELGNPYSLCPEGYRGAKRQPQVRGAEYDADLDSYAAPFLMGAINSRIVQRSNALSGQAYGSGFLYDEAVLTGRGLGGRAKALGIGAGLAGFMVASAIGPSRFVLERFVVPKPGEGPSADEQERGFFDIRFHGRTEGGEELRAKVTGDRDPGYGSTARMLGQAAACLALDVPADVPGGFWTPATLLGGKLVERLRAHSGLAFEIV